MKRRYKKYWYGIIRNMVRNYKDLVKDDSAASKQFVEAVRNTIEEVSRDKGEEKARVIRTYLDSGCDYTYTIRNAYYEDRKVQEIISSFIYSVGEKMGFK